MNNNDRFKQIVDAAFGTVINGSVRMQVNIHQGEAQYFVSEEFTHKYYKALEDGTTQATKTMLDELTKAIRESRSGTLSFTLEINEGKTKAAHIQKAYKQYIQIWQDINYLLILEFITRLSASHIGTWPCYQSNGAGFFN